MRRTYIGPLPTVVFAMDVAACHVRSQDGGQRKAWGGVSIASFLACCMETPASEELGAVEADAGIGEPRAASVVQRAVCL